MSKFKKGDKVVVLGDYRYATKGEIWTVMFMECRTKRFYLTRGVFSWWIDEEDLQLAAEFYKLKDKTDVKILFDTLNI